MTAKFARPGDRLRLLALVLLILGVLAAVAVYIAAAGPADVDASGYRIVGGRAYADTGDDSRELQQLERLGGKAAVLTFKFQRWFSSLWRGQRLAYTLTLIGATLALLCWHIANLMDEPEGT
jgi:hypothetical protein